MTPALLFPVALTYASSTVSSSFSTSTRSSVIAMLSPKKMPSQCEHQPGEVREGNRRETQGGTFQRGKMWVRTSQHHLEGMPHEIEIQCHCSAYLFARHNRRLCHLARQPNQVDSFRVLCLFCAQYNAQAVKAPGGQLKRQPGRQETHELLNQRHCKNTSSSLAGGEAFRGFDLREYFGLRFFEKHQPSFGDSFLGSPPLRYGASRKAAHFGDRRRAAEAVNNFIGVHSRIS